MPVSPRLVGAPRSIRRTATRLATTVLPTAILLAAAVLPASAQLDATIAGAERARDGEVVVLMRTDVGDLVLGIDTLRAPVTGTNFLRYVDAGLYGGGTFYRAVRDDNQPDDSVRIDVVQGGMDRARRRQAFDPIALEGTEQTGLRHLDGTLSMARSGPHSARAEFFITLGPQPSLDAGGNRNPDGLGFAAFGRVLGGMEVVHDIHGRPADGQYLVTRVAIQFAERIGPRTPGGAPPEP